MEEDRVKAWKLYWKGLGPRPIPIDMESVKRAAQQIRDHPVEGYQDFYCTHHDD